MKKTYIQPQINQELIAEESMICASVSVFDTVLTGSEDGYESASKSRIFDDFEDDYEDNVDGGFELPF